MTLLQNLVRVQMNRQLTVAACGLLTMTTFGARCRADTVTDWDAIATAAAPPAALGEREVTLVDLAMFDAVNSIERRYQPYLSQLPATQPISADAAAASAAANALQGLHPETAASFKHALAEYLAHLNASPEALANGAHLGEAVALKILEVRSNDGATAMDSYRPKTQPGQYVPTAVMVSSTWSTARPFALRSPSQFRPGPPLSLKSRAWAADYNEIKSLGGKLSTTRTAQQTETARFWLMAGPQAYHPLARQAATARQLNLLDSARFMALYGVALTDAYIAVFDAKYHYEFWRPVTAIRNGDLDDNLDTVRDATWLPLDNTPLHPEYPCAHCIESAAARVILESLGQPLPELSLTSTTAPGVTHYWTNLDDFTTEVANARVWAGFHYRFSTRIGTTLGQKVGQYVAGNVMQPVDQGTTRLN
jgi:PAP2 superfamily